MPKCKEAEDMVVCTGDFGLQPLCHKFDECHIPSKEKKDAVRDEDVHSGGSTRAGKKR